MKPIRSAINGYGRIGRGLMRALLNQSAIDVVAINDRSDDKTTVHLTKYDSVHHTLKCDVHLLSPGLMQVGDRQIHLIHQENPYNLPWSDLGIDLVFECTGQLLSRYLAEEHLRSGASKVLVSAPCENADHTIVFGINENLIKPTDTIISNASCTTNCLAHIAAPLHNALDIVSGTINTIHAYTSDQKLLDAHHKDLRRARSATQSIIPTKTGATKTLGLVIPELKGKIDGLAFRVPTPNVSLLDFTFHSSKSATSEEVNEILSESAKKHSTCLWITHEPLVSIDWNECPASAILDAPLTQALPGIVKVCAWYDNEWGFIHRMIDTSLIMYQKHKNV